MASLEVRVMLDVTPEELGGMLARGWRRFGPCYFRPQCPACEACVTLRVNVADFHPSRSQRRARNRAARLRRTVGRPIVDEARLELYRKWHREREAHRGWEPSPLRAERYALDFAFPPAEREVAIVMHEGGAERSICQALVALGLRLRALQDRGLAEVPSTRLLIAAARLIASGVEERDACYAAVVSPLSDDATLVGAMRDLVDATFV